MATDEEGGGANDAWRRIPLDGHDILSYAIPGFVAIALFALFESHVAISEIQYLGAARVREYIKDWGVLAVAAIGLAIGSYLVGHGMAALSSLFIERGLVLWGYGYPHLAVLEPGDEARLRPADTLKALHKGLCAGGTLTLIVAWFGAANRPAFLVDPVWLAILPILWTLVHSWQCLYPHVVERVPSRGGGQVRSEHSRPQHTTLLSAVYEYPSWVLSKYLETRSGLGEGFGDEFRKSFNRAFSLAPSQAESLNFWWPQMYVRSHSADLGRTFMKFVSLYGLFRNLAMSFVVVSLWTTKQIVFGDHAWTMFPVWTFALGLLSLTRYYYLYASQGTKFLFRAFVFLENQNARRERSDAPSE